MITRGDLLDIRNRITSGSSKDSILQQLDILIRNSPDYSQGPSNSSPESRHPSSQKFHDLLKKLGELHDKKQQDYGSDSDPFMNIRASQELGISAIKGAQLRANDKTKRILRWLCGSKLSNEGVLDSLQDRMVYDGITTVLIEEAQEQGINVESMLNVNLQS